LTTKISHHNNYALKLWDGLNDIYHVLNWNIS
jgi:hypothetical protein